MLGLLCPECSIVKIFPPCIRSTCLYSCILENNIKLLGIFAARKIFCVDIVIFFGKKLILLYCDAYVCIAYIDVPKVHWQTIYCGKFTVEKMGHSAWAMFGQHDSWIISNISISAKHTLKVDETRWMIKLAREPVYFLKSPSWPGMCIFIELSFIK